MKDHLLSWLGLTDQQSLLVGIILDLQSNNKSTAPINIEKEYIKHTNNFIQKSNLFTQLKILQEKKIIRKGEQSKYYLDIDGIKEAISIKKQELTKRLDEITHLESETDLLLEKIGTTKKPSTIYLNEQELYKRIISALQNAENLYLGCDFPHYSYPLPLCTSSYQMLYIETLNEKLNNKDFKLFCLCSSKLDAILSQLESKGIKKEAIRDELETLRKDLLERKRIFKNIDMRKSNSPIDFALIEDKTGNSSLFMFLKNENRIITGGIAISSRDTVKQIKQHFLSQMANSQHFDIDKEIESANVYAANQIKKDKLIVFDVNRVFTQTHTTVEIAKKVGKYKPVSELIRKQIEGDISVEEAIDKSAKLFAGLEVAVIKELSQKIPLMKNVRHGIEKLKREGYHIVAISTGFSQIIVPLCASLGIEEVYCNVLEEKDGKVTGNISEKNVAVDDVKYYIVKYLIEKYSLQEEKTVGVGDGYSDLDMLKAVKLKVAFNPTKKLISLFKEKSPLISLLIKEKDFMVLTNQIIKNS